MVINQCLSHKSGKRQDTCYPHLYWHWLCCAFSLLWSGRHWPYHVLTRVWSNWNSLSTLGEYKICITTLRNSLAVSSNVKQVPSIWSTILCLDIFPKEIKVYVHINTCTWMFISALLVKAENKSNAHQQGMNKQLYIHIRKDSSAIKRNKILQVCR